MNPEFQRNLYLEFSVARVIGMPLFLLIIFALTYLMNDSKFNESTASVAMFLYVFIVFFWGARQATESIFDEIRNHTWDIQKTSAISPWSLTWGKLFGSTIFNWYGGILCLIVYTLTAPEASPVFIITGFSLVGGLLVQALGLLVGISVLHKKQTFNPNISYLFVLFVLLQILGIATSFDSAYFHSLHWHSYEIDSKLFSLISLAFACGWSIVGIYRTLAQELQIRTLPWVWLLFCGFLIIYTHGLIVGSSFEEPIFHTKISNVALLSLIILAVGISLTYTLILMDDNNPMLMRRLWIYSSQENWLRFMEEVPCWLISLVIVLPVSFYLTFVMPLEATEKLHFYPLVLFLLMLRDVALILFFNYAPNPKRALGLSLLYLTFLYWVIPAIFTEMGADMLAALFLPLFSDNVGLGVILAAGQAAIMSYFLFNRWQSTVNTLKNDA